MSELFDPENIEPTENDIFEFTSSEEQTGPIVVPIGELIYHQVMTAVSSALFHYVEVFNELGNVKLLKEDDIKMMLEKEEGDDVDE
jgi:hypothetical protein